MHARKRGVESFEKGEKDVKRGKNREKSMCMKRKKNKYVYERMKERRKKKKEEWQ
jgi:hypothetical protein